MNELFDAVSANDDVLARNLARERPELLEQRDEKGLLPAMRALYEGSPELAADLLPADRVLTVFEAATFGRLDRLGEVLEGDPDLVSAFSPDGFTPLHLACFAGGAQAARLLIERGAPLEVLARSAFASVRPLGTAAFSRDHESARALLEAGADANGRARRDFTPLHAAAKNGDGEMIRLLLDHGADPGLTFVDGRRAEDLAREAGHEDCARLLDETSPGCRAPGRVPPRGRG